MSSMRSRSAELGQAVAALRLFGVDAENAVLIRIEGQRQAVRQHVRLQRLDSGESRDPKASSHDDHQFESRELQWFPGFQKRATV
jgi:hypothetical protein